MTTVLANIGRKRLIALNYSPSVLLSAGEDLELIHPNVSRDISTTGSHHDLVPRVAGVLVEALLARCVQSVEDQWRRARWSRIEESFPDITAVAATSSISSTTTPLPCCSSYSTCSHSADDFVDRLAALMARADHLAI